MDMEPTSYAQNTPSVWRLQFGKKSIEGIYSPKFNNILDVSENKHVSI